MEIRMKKKFIICELLVAGILTIVISMYQKDKTSEAEHEEWIKIQYSNQNGAFFNRSAWIDYHNAELLNETKVWVDLYVYNQYVSKEEKIFLEDVKEYLGSEYNADGSLRIESGYEKINNYVNWYEYTTEQGDTGQKIIEKYKDKLHFEIEWEYKRTQNSEYEIKLIDELSIPQVEELIKKYEDSSYEINDDIMMEKE